MFAHYLASLLILALSIINNGIQCLPQGPSLTQQQPIHFHHTDQNEQFNKMYSENALHGPRSKFHPFETGSSNAFDPDIEGKRFFIVVVYIRFEMLEKISSYIDYLN